jgi:hypothetical protein
MSERDVLRSVTARARWKTIGRRGLMAGVAALVGGAMAKTAPAAPAHADDGSDLVIGQFNVGHTTTELGFDLTASTSPVFKVSDVHSATCVYGVSLLPGGGGTGARGDSVTGVGVHGISESNDGVRGQSTSGVGVHGLSESSDAITGKAKQGAGVVGQSDTGAGVVGKTASNVSPAISGQGGAAGAGVLGFVDTGTGVEGRANGTGVGVMARAHAGIGLIALNEAEGGTAGLFFGNVTIKGGLKASVKNAIVQFPDGSQRLLTCVESPEVWFEDFGEGTLTKGRAEVRIDPDFASIVNLALAYHVFLTPHDSKIKGLAVTARLADHFVVEDQDSASAGTFSYQIVAKRKGYERQRFERVEVPPPPPPPSSTR